MTEKKEPLNWALSFICPTPPRNSHSKTRGDLPYKIIVLLIPHWRINWEVVPLTVLKCNILNYSKNCNAKGICGWTIIARHRPTALGYYKKLLRRRNMKKKYMISCGSTSWVGWIRWEWKYGRHCAIIDILFSFSIPAPWFFFSLCSPLAPFSAHLNTWNRPVLTMKILHWVIDSLRGRHLKGKGKGVLGARETRGAREEGGEEGNACQETIVFAIPPTNYVCKNNATVND